MCNVSVAETNSIKGLCPVAGCLGNEWYPKGCKRVNRVYRDSYGSCCLKQCHLENDKNETCTTIDSQCNPSIAEKNTKKGACPIAKCVGDERYPKGCKRVKRINSEDYGTCCFKQCHLENDKNETCRLIDRNQYSSNASYNKKIDNLYPNFFLVIFFLLLIMKK